MRFSARHLIVLPCIVAVVALAGCGSAANGSSTPTAIPAATTHVAALPTVAVPATPVIRGGSTAAIVNGHAIPMSTFRSVLIALQREAAIQPQTAGQPPASLSTMAQQAMNEVIADEVLRQYAAAHGIHLSSSAVDAALKQQAQQVGGQRGLRQHVAQLGLTLSAYRSLVTANLLGQKVVQKVAPLKKQKEEAAQVRHILITTHPKGKPVRTNAQAHALASRILSQIQHGANFASLARKNSDDTGSAAQGGNLGKIFPNETVAPFNHAAFTLPLNHPALVHSVYGYHIVEVLRRGKAPVPAQTQQQQQAQVFNTWMDRQIGAAKIRRIATVATTKH